MLNAQAKVSETEEAAIQKLISKRDDVTKKLMEDYWISKKLSSAKADNEKMVPSPHSNK